MKLKNIFQKLAGIFSTAAIVAVGLAPNVFNIPLFARPWTFLLAVAWIILVASGVLPNE